MESPNDSSTAVKSFNDRYLRLTFPLELRCAPAAAAAQVGVERPHRVALRVVVAVRTGVLVVAALAVTVERRAAVGHGRAIGVLLEQRHGAREAVQLRAVPLLVLPPGGAVRVLPAAHVTV